jgi:selenoprotein W-related protein
MAEAIKTALDIESELEKSSGGVFEITLEDKLVFSKKSTGRFPTEQEVIEGIKKLC